MYKYRTFEDQILDELDAIHLEQARLELVLDGSFRQYIERNWHARDLKQALIDYDDSLEFRIEKENDHVLADQEYTLTVWEQDYEWQKEDYDDFFEEIARKSIEKLLNNERDYD